MEQFLGSIVAAMAAGALAKAGEIVGADVIVKAYDSLRASIVHKLGKSGAVQTVEDDPHSEAAKAMLAEALAKAGLADDRELKTLADTLLSAAPNPNQNEATAITIGNIIAGANVLIQDMIASGKVTIGDIRGGTDVTMSGFRVGADPSKKA